VRIKISLFLFIFLSLLLISSRVSFAASDMAQLLRDLQNFGVDCTFQVSDKDKVWINITKDQVKTYVELKLRKASIKVIDKKGFLPYLNIDFLLYEIGPSNYCLVLSCSLIEIVNLDRKTKITGELMTKTWQTEGKVYRIFKGKLKANDILDEIGYLVDIFINDYLFVNQR